MIKRFSLSCPFYALALKSQSYTKDLITNQALKKLPYKGVFILLEKKKKLNMLFASKLLTLRADMTYLFSLLVLLFAFFPVLKADEHPRRFEGGFEGWYEKRMELVSMFLPHAPTIVHVGEYYDYRAADVLLNWPEANLIPLDSNVDEWCENKGIERVDLLGITSLESLLSVLENSPKSVSNSQSICVSTFNENDEFTLLRSTLEKKGFRLLGHWYDDGDEGDAVFVRNDFFDVFDADELFFSRRDFINGNYTLCAIDYPVSYFYIDDIQDSIKTSLKEKQTWEGNIWKCITELTPKGTNVIDIGAHIGVHCVTLSRAVGAEGAVIAFEPQKKMYLEQLQNLRKNRCHNVISINKALGSTCQTVQMSETDPSNEGGTLIGEGGDFVEMTTLDSYNFSNVSLIKLDVENYELFVLEGAQKTILKNKPIIIFELNGSNYNKCLEKEQKNTEMVASLLESLGYDIYVFYGKDCIAFPSDAPESFLEYRSKLKRLDVKQYDLD